MSWTQISSNSKFLQRNHNAPNEKLLTDNDQTEMPQSKFGVLIQSQNLSSKKLCWVLPTLLPLLNQDNSGNSYA